MASVIAEQIDGSQLYSLSGYRAVGTAGENSWAGLTRQRGAVSTVELGSLERSRCHEYVRGGLMRLQSAHRQALASLIVPLRPVSRAAEQIARLWIAFLGFGRLVELLRTDLDRSVELIKRLFEVRDAICSTHRCGLSMHPCGSLRPGARLRSRCCGLTPQNQRVWRAFVPVRELRQSKRSPRRFRPVWARCRSIVL